ncbi:serine O-acetyltransferase [Marinagarivorans algicola]|uniref:serine O-acetyltransferase n=1 Tax=Marinagarivorans algicola TaxID=1513270 RepID=UPI0006B602A5|nr:serine acetyltransferase [Marinagarivorans algicola]
MSPIPAKGSTNTNPSSLSFYALIKEDFKTHECDFFSQGFWAVFNHRLGNWRMKLKYKIIRIPFTVLYNTHKKLIQITCGIKLDYTVKLGRRVKIEHFGGMIIGANTIGDDVIIRQNTTMGIKNLNNLEGKPHIGNSVSIGAGAVIVGDITIGDHCVIGPNTVVYQDIPPYSTVYPATPTIITRTNN